jgi:hypothetical protein
MDAVSNNAETRTNTRRCMDFESTIHPPTDRRGRNVDSANRFVEVSPETPA